MKKISTLLLASICYSASLYAQAPPSAKSMLDLVRKRNAAFGPAYAPSQAHKGTATPELLTDEADYNDYSGGGLQLTDSAHFIYGSKGRSKFDHNNFEYIDLSLLDFGMQPAFLSVEPSPNNYDSSFFPHVFFDTLQHYVADTITSSMYRRHMQLSSLNPDTSFGMITNNTYFPAGTTPVHAERQVVLYNAGRIAQVFGLTDYGGGFDTFSVRTIKYAGSTNLVVVDSMDQDYGSGLMNTNMAYYSYNSAGQYITKVQTFLNWMSGSVDTGIRISYAYYPDGKLRTLAYEQPNSSNLLQLVARDSLSYTAGVPGYTGLFEESYDDTGAVNFTYRMVTNTINAMQLKDSATITVSFMGADLDIASVKLNYNANGSPVKGTMYDLMTGTISAVRHWYYKTSAPGASVKPVQLASVRIAPNPTTGLITLNYAAANAGTPVSVRIANMAGQLVHAESFTLKGTQQQIMLGSEATPGMYLISVLDANGNQLYSGKIVKQ